jgi:hypothetical protein
MRIAVPPSDILKCTECHLRYKYLEKTGLMTLYASTLNEMRKGLTKEPSAYTCCSLKYLYLISFINTHYFTAAGRIAWGPVYFEWCNSYLLSPLRDSL